MSIYQNCQGGSENGDRQPRTYHVPHKNAVGYNLPGIEEHKDLSYLGAYLPPGYSGWDKTLDVLM